MDELELLKAFRESVPDPTAGQVESQRATLLEMVTQGAAFPRPRRPSRRPMKGRRRWAIPAGVAAAVVAVGLALPAILPGGEPGGASPAAAEWLDNTAQVASHQPDSSPPRPGQFVYTKTQGASQSAWVTGPGTQGFSVLMPTVREAWIGTDGAGRLLETNGQPTFLSDADRANWVSAWYPDLGANKTSDEMFKAGGLSFQDLSGLPTDPNKLKALIEERTPLGYAAGSGPPGDAESFSIIADLLHETYASPELRSALYQVAGMLPGVELVGQVKDPAGRTGVAVAYTSGGRRHELIFDPHTSALLGEQYVVTDPSKWHVEAGTVVGWAAYLSSGIVDSTSARP